MKKLLLILTMMQGVSHAQITVSDVFAYGLLPAISGFSDGVAEALIWHYPQFQAKYPNADPQAWNPHVSWTNKWQNGNPNEGEKFFGSSTVFAWTTDKYHQARTLHRVSLLGSFTIQGVDLSKNNPKLAITLLKMLAGTVVYSAGFHLSYSIIMQ